MHDDDYGITIVLRSPMNIATMVRATTIAIIITSIVDSRMAFDHNISYMTEVIVAVSVMAAIAFSSFPTMIDFIAPLH